MGELLFNVKTLLFALFANAFIAFGIIAYSGVAFQHPFDFENLNSNFAIDNTSDYSNPLSLNGNVIYVGSGVSIPPECSGNGKFSIRCLSSIANSRSGSFYNGVKTNLKR